MVNFTTDVTEDQWTQSSTPDSNMGADSTMYVYWDGSTIYRNSHIQFDISSLPSAIFVSSAVLKVYVANKTNTPIHIKKELSTFDETTITWNNKPSVTGDITTPSITTTGWWELDVKTLIESSLGDSTFGVQLNSTFGPGGVTLYTKDKTPAYTSQLIIEYALASDHYYVKTSGDDTKDGSSWANAWATINKAATTVADGKTVHIGFGTYNAEPANNDIAPVNAGAVGIKYLPETATTGGGTGSVIVEVN